MTRSIALITALALAGLTGCQTPRTTDLLPSDARRMPAEWEEQEAVWLQWPNADWNETGIEDAFTEIVRVVAQYETVRLLANDDATEERGRSKLAGIDGTIEWYQAPVAATWMRDNGPRYVLVDGEMVLQNWEFDGYHDGRPASMWRDDNDNPDAVAALLDLPLEQVGLVHERGDLEVNGSDTAIVNWSVVGHRNPGITRAQATEQFRAALGVERVIYLEGFDPSDVTRGHVDGAARFVNATTVVVPDNGTQLYEDFARQIAEQAPDLTVRRLQLHPDDPTINWLIGDGFLLTGTTGDANADADIAEELKEYFPDRAMHFIDIGALWQNGGGVHCVTNDQPAAP